jgi:hypothetical protein
VHFLVIGRKGRKERFALTYSASAGQQLEYTVRKPFILGHNFHFRNYEEICDILTRIKDNAQATSPKAAGGRSKRLSRRQKSARFRDLARIRADCVDNLAVLARQQTAAETTRSATNASRVLEYGYRAVLKDPLPTRPSTPKGGFVSPESIEPPVVKINEPLKGIR